MILVHATYVRCVVLVNRHRVAAARGEKGARHVDPAPAASGREACRVCEAALTGVYLKPSKMGVGAWEGYLAKHHHIRRPSGTYWGCDSVRAVEVTACLLLPPSIGAPVEMPQGHGGKTPAPCCASLSWLIPVPPCSQHQHHRSRTFRGQCTAFGLPVATPPLLLQQHQEGVQVRRTGLLLMLPIAVVSASSMPSVHWQPGSRKQALGCVAVQCICCCTMHLLLYNASVARKLVLRASEQVSRRS
jgi:hypothetical protein